MRALLFLIFFTLSLSAARGQQLGFSGGYCFNNLYGTSDYGRISSSYEDGSGYSMSINLDDVKLVDKMWDMTYRFAFALNFSHYDGYIKSSSWGASGGYYTEGEFDKSVLGLRIYLANFKFLKEFKIGVGLEFNYLITSSVTGTSSSSVMGSGSTHNLEDSPYDIFDEWQAGLVGRLGYNFHVRDQWYVIPEYNFNLGFSGEYSYFGEQVHSIRHYFMLGIAYRFK